MGCWPGLVAYVLSPGASICAFQTSAAFLRTASRCPPIPFLRPFRHQVISRLPKTCLSKKISKRQADEWSGNRLAISSFIVLMDGASLRLILPVMPCTKARGDWAMEEKLPCFAQG